MQETLVRHQYCSYCFELGLQHNHLAAPHSTRGGIYIQFALSYFAQPIHSQAYKEHMPHPLPLVGMSGGLPLQITHTQHMQDPHLLVGVRWSDPCRTTNDSAAHHTTALHYRLPVPLAHQSIVGVRRSANAEPPDNSPSLSDNAPLCLTDPCARPSDSPVKPLPPASA